MSKELKFSLVKLFYFKRFSYLTVAFISVMHNYINTNQSLGFTSIWLDFLQLYSKLHYTAQDGEGQSQYDGHTYQAGYPFEERGLPQMYIASLDSLDW